jgi:hypothetical protein
VHSGGIVGGGIGGMGSQSLTEVGACSPSRQLGTSAWLAACQLGPRCPFRLMHCRHLPHLSKFAHCSASSVPVPGPAVAELAAARGGAAHAGRPLPQRGRSSRFCCHWHSGGSGNCLRGAHWWVVDRCGGWWWVGGGCLAGSPACAACRGRTPPLHLPCMVPLPLPPSTTVTSPHFPVLLTVPPPQAACCSASRRAPPSTQPPSSGGASWPPVWVCSLCTSWRMPRTTRGGYWPPNSGASATLVGGARACRGGPQRETAWWDGLAGACPSHPISCLPAITSQLPSKCVLPANAPIPSAICACLQACTPTTTLRTAAACFTTCGTFPSSVA